MGTTTLINLAKLNAFRLRSQIAIFSLFLSALSLPGSESIASGRENIYQVIAKGLFITLPLMILPVSRYLTSERIQKNLLLMLIGAYGILTVLWSPMHMYSLIRSVSFIITVIGVTIIFYAYITEMKNPYSAILFDLFLTTGIILWFFTIIGICHFDIAWRKVYLANGIISRLGGDILPPNTLGALAAINIILALRNGFNKKFFNHISIISSCYVLILSNSKSAVIGLLVSGIIIIVISAFTMSNLKLVSLIFLSFSILIATLFFLEPNTLEKGAINISRYSDIEEYTTLTGRTLIWGKFFSQPILPMLTGYGYGILSESGIIIVRSLMTTNAHNGFLQIFAGTGLIGLFLFLFYMFHIIINLKTVKKKSHNIFWTILSLLIFILINNFSESSFGGQIVPQLIIFLFISILITSDSEKSKIIP